MTGTPDRGRLVPASYAQQSLWFSEQLNGQDGLLNLAPCRRLSGRLDTAALCAAVVALVARHEMLRTTFRLVGDALMQQVHADLPADFAFVDLGVDSAAGADPSVRCRRLAAAESMRSFDLAAGPLARVRLYRLSADDHVLLFAMHHLVCDRWSVDVLWRDLGALYRTHLDGTPPALPPLSVQYADYATAQRAALYGDHLDELREYWTAALDGGSAVLELPGDHPRPRRRTRVGATVRMPLPSDLVTDAIELARRERVTPFVFFLAVFRVLLWRHTGQPDQRIGIAVAERHQIEYEELIGFFVNMLVPRNPLPGYQTGFRAVLAAERRANIEAFEHRDLPYPLLVDALRPGREPTGSPLFAVSFSYQGQARTGPSTWHPVRVEPFPLDVSVCQFDLVVDVVRSAAGTEVVWAFNDELFEAQTITRLAERLPVLLRAVVADPDRTIGDLPVLSTKDDIQLRELRAGAGAPDPTGGDVVDIFDRWVARGPADVAVRHADQTRTYRQTARLSRAVAGRLAGFGLAAETAVGLLLRRSADLPAVILGVLRAGLTAVPVDPTHPAERIMTTLTDAGVAVLIHDGGHSPDGVTDSAGVATDSPPVDGAWQVLTVAEVAGAGGSPPVGRHAGQLAYLLYTSGSTGTPKGVAVTHGALANCLCATRDALPYRPGQRWLAVSRTAFDISLLELLTPLVSGGEVVVATDEQARDGTALRALVESCDPDFMQATPGLWRMLYDSGWSGNARLTVLTGGDVVSPALAARLIADNAGFWHTYGPTEATLYCVSTPLTSVAPDQVLPLGRPICGTGVQVLDRNLRPVPPGVVGELCVTGAGVARGYLNRPDHTAERFVPDPYTARPGARLYRTGDLALVRPDGRLEWRGRNDHQIKLRGYRIELGEIENVLTGYPGVVAGAVSRVGSSPDTYRLVAHVQVVPGTALDGLRDQVERRLPRYMTPSTYHVVERIPMTANGKVDREALARLTAVPDGVHVDQGSGAGDPVTEEEAGVAAVWLELLDVDTVSGLDDFFILGGNSLLAVRAVRMLGERFGVDLSIRVLFEAPTVTELARRISELTAVAASNPPESPLTWLRGRQPAPLLALVHPAGGSVLCYRELTAALRPGRHVCAFESTVASGDASVEALAARYLDHLPAGWQPEHTVLAGWSMGGLVAYEMAVQLARRTGVTPPVVLIDTQILAGSASAELSPDQALEAFVADIASTLGLAPAELPRDLDRLGPVVGLDRSRLSHRFDIMRANAALAARYVPPRYPGPVDFVAAAERPDTTAAAWRSCAERLTVTTVPGDHYTALRGPGARRIAQLVDVRTIVMAEGRR
jgi:amino acid adenylation domain-containing protein